MIVERSLSDTEIDALLTSEMFCHLACSEGGKPYVVPMAYVFHKNTIYGQTTEGKKVDILRKNPLACFQVEKREEHHWSSAMCWGTFEELDFDALEQSEAKEIYKLLTDRLGGIQETVGITIPSFSFSGKAAPLMVHNRKSTLFRIVITEKMGKFYAMEE
jgi:nitroimidazol reductase NimA-like FMN-containing flavoprotein (pyridoxamine 5'-phosphate oxidase superfamily)